MKAIILAPAIAALLALTACGDTSVNTDTPEAVKAKAEKMEARAAKALETKDLGDVIDYFDNEAKEMTVVLKSVTDGPSAKTAISEVRAVIPRLNAAINSLQNQDLSDMKASLALMSKMPAILETQGELVTELSRIAEIPEAREVLEEEFDKLDILK